MLHPKCLVLTTRHVIEGAPILGIDYSPDDWKDDVADNSVGPGGGQFSGWTLVHTHDTVPDDASLYFFEDVKNIDAAVRQIVEEAVPGTCARESEFAPFDRL